MSWNMIIFGFGFLVGGCTAMLLLGLLSLANDRSSILEDRETVRAPIPYVTKPEIYPPLTVLRCGKDQPTFVNGKQYGTSNSYSEPM